MDRSSRIRIALMALLVALAVAACGDRAMTASPFTSASPETSPLQAGACALEVQPGPADEPPRDNGEVDASDLGAGRWRLCADLPLGLMIEGTAWCTWSADRVRVLEVAGLPKSIGPTDIDAWIALERRQVGVGRTDKVAGGLVATYETGAVAPLIEAAADGRAGAAAFRAELVVDPGSGAPAAVPGVFAGLFRWACADPPLVVATNTED